MPFSRWRPHVLVSALACVLAFALVSPARADSHTVTATAGPVTVPTVPISLCVDSTCVTSPTVITFTLSASATVDSSVPLPTLTPGVCPAGEAGALITVTVQSVTATVTISGSISGTGPNGPVGASVGPKTVTIAPGSHGATVSACAH